MQNNNYYDQEYNNNNRNQYYNNNNMNTKYNAIDDNYNNNNNNDYENDNIHLALRKGFIKKTLIILLAQIILTISFAFLTLNIPEVKNFQLTNKAFLYLAIFIAIIISVTLFCFIETARAVPMNYLLLILFTLAEAYICGYFCITTNTKVVLMALSMTCTLVFCLILYAFLTKTDFTGYGQYLFLASISMLVIGIFLTFTNNKVMHVVFSGFAVFIFSVYLIYDVQLIVGNHENKLDYDDYIIGAMVLYVDIIKIFEHILNILK